MGVETKFDAEMAAQIEADIDVAIIGAGISGIGMAAHMQAMCPDRSFALFERRENLGGSKVRISWGRSSIISCGIPVEAAQC